MITKTITLFFILLSFFVKSQTQGVAFSSVGKGAITPFVTDYHCLGINASALGWGTGYEGKKITTGSSEFAFALYSDSLNSDRLKNLSASLWNKFTKKENTTNGLTTAEATAMYSEAGIGISADYNWGGFAFQGKRLGGIAFNVRESYQWYSKLSKNATDVIFRGNLASIFDSLTIAINGDTSRIANSGTISQDTLQHVISGYSSIPLQLSQVLNGTQIKMVWNRSYNLGYGRKIIGNDSTFAIYGGVAGRIIVSKALFDLQSDVDGLVIHSSLSNSFGIDYSGVSGSNLLPNSGGPALSVGNGYGIDFAVSVALTSKFRFSLAVNNIGSVTYKRNVFTVQDTTFNLLSLQGFGNTNITNSISQLLMQGGVVKMIGQEKHVLQNASDIRIGGSFAPFKFLKMGFDFVAPFNKENPGSIQNAIFSFGGEIRILKFLVLNAGYFGGGIYQNNMPLGVTFVLRNGGYEFGIASRDALSFFTKDGHSLSAAIGFARFRF
jgi:hypothetical protein